MRRMNYNPFENVYASGEYDKEGQRFILDRSLEPNHIYYLNVFSPTGLCSFGPSLLDFRDNSDFVVSMIPMFDVSEEVYIFGLRVNRESNIIATTHPAVAISPNDEYTIYVYRLI